MQEEKRKNPKQPDDDVAQELESRELWRRAACRWRYVLSTTEDAWDAERIIRRIAWCQRQMSQCCPGTLILTANDVRHIDRVARAQGCGPIARYWIE